MNDADLNSALTTSTMLNTKLHEMLDPRLTSDLQLSLPGLQGLELNVLS